MSFLDDFEIAPAKSGPTGPTVELSPNAPVSGPSFERDFEVAPAKIEELPDNGAYKGPNLGPLQRAKKKEPPKQDTDTYTSLVNAATGNAINAVPIVGPYIKGGLERAAAGVRSQIYGTPYADELANVRAYNNQSTEAHPIASTAGELGGGVGSLLTGAVAAPTAFGIAGPLWQRAAAGFGTGSLINGLDTAVRTPDQKQAATNAVVGGLVGGGLPVVGKGLGLAGEKIFGSGLSDALVQKAEALGIPVTFAQASNSPFIQKLSQMAGKVPGSGMARLMQDQRDGVYRAVANTFGEDTPQLTRDTLQSAYKRIGGVMDQVEGRTTIPIDHDLMQGLGKVASNVKSVYTEDSPQYKAIVGHINDILHRAAQHGDALPGKVYKSLVETGSDLDNLISSKEPISKYGNQIKETLRDALARNATPEDMAAYQRARFQYKNAKTVEPLILKGRPGEISPLLLQNRVAKQFGAKNPGPLGDVADVAQRFLREPSDSGTPLGELALRVALGAGPAALGAGLLGYKSNYDPLEMLQGAAAGGASMLGARGITTLLNKPQNIANLLQKTPAAVPSILRLVNGNSPPQ